MATATKKPAAKAAKPAAKSAAKKHTAKKAAPRTSAPKPVELTPIDDGVNVTVNDDRTVDLNIKGRFDQDGLISVAKRVNEARGAVS